MPLDPEALPGSGLPPKSRNQPFRRSFSIQMISPKERSAEVDSIFQTYSSFKLALGQDYGLTEDLLHVHAGLIIFFFTALFSRQRMYSVVPIAIVYALAIINELVDVLTPGKTAGPWEPVADIANTVVWPTLLFLLARRRIGRDRVMAEERDSSE